MTWTVLDTPSEQALIHICGVVAYDGTDYHGFQYQQGVPTIQATLEAALSTFTKITGRVVGAGRTDTGVHAHGQVIAVKLLWRHSLSALQRAWNAHLPASIAVRQIQLAPEGFHPRFSALHRTYRYQIYQALSEDKWLAPSHAPLFERFALYETRSLNLAALHQASAYLVGEHDFATFGQPPQGENTVRVLSQVDWQVIETNLPLLAAQFGRSLMLTITANAFLRQMVRNIVGTLLEVALGHWAPEAVAVALAAQDRRYCAPPAPPQGLVLERVAYPEQFGLFL